VSTHFFKINIKSLKSIIFLLDVGVGVVVVGDAVVVTVPHMLMSGKGTQTGDGQHESTIHTEFGDGHAELFDVHRSNVEQETAGEHTVAPDDVLNT
jgi:hypothetical protein